MDDQKQRRLATTREPSNPALAALGEPAELKPFTTWCEKNAALGTEPTKDDEWPRYWWWGSDDFGSLHREDMQMAHIITGSKMSL